MKRNLVLLLLAAVAAAACSRADASFPQLSPLPPVSTPRTITPILQMPNVVGMLYADARDALRLRGFDVAKKIKFTSKDPKDRVIRQSRRVGAILEPGYEITLTVATPLPDPVNGNPWGYNFACCLKIFAPPADFCDYFNCVTTFYNGDGYVVQCDDLTYSQTGGTKQVCSTHDGYKRTLLNPAGA